MQHAMMIAIPFLLLSTVSEAQQRQQAVQNLLEPLFACLEGPSPGRATCLENETRRLQDAERKRGVVVLDRDRAAAIEMSAKRNDEERRAKEAREAAATFTPITSTLTGVSQRGGRWIFDVEGAGTWMQVEAGELGRDPRPGDEVRVRRGAIGGFLLNVRTGPAIRVRRLP